VTVAQQAQQAPNDHLEASRVAFEESFDRDRSRLSTRCARTACGANQQQMDDLLAPLIDHFKAEDWFP
jgi:hypothetical protein